jgi:hypothetical protein
MTYPDYTPTVTSPPRTRAWHQDTGRSLEPRSLNSLDVNDDALVRTGGTDLDRNDSVDSLALPPPDDCVDSIAQINAVGHVIPPAVRVITLTWCGGFSINEWKPRIHKTHPPVHPNFNAQT